MLKRIFDFVLVVLLACGLCTGSAGAEMLYRYNAPESSHDTRYLYHWKILETALEKTRKQYGDYRMQTAEFMTEQRQAEELKSDSGKLTVMYLDTNPVLENSLHPVRIPVDKNLGGYRIFLIRKQDAQKFKSVRTLDDLRKFTYGLGLGWLDVEILRANQFRVVTGSSYEGLFEMLHNRRFDVFLRAAVEVLDEYEERKSLYPDMLIEPDILLYYPLPMYFWFAKSEEGRKLAERAESGMRMMIRDGSYERIFAQYQAHKIARLNLANRRLFKIGNPLLVPETPFADRKLWFDLQHYKGRK